MIVKGTTPRKTTPAQRFLLATLVAGTLLVFPTWIDRAAADEDSRSPREQRFEAELLELEMEATELERRMREVEAAKLEINAALREERAQAKLEMIEKRAAAAEASGKFAEAEELRRAAEDAQRHQRLKAEQLETELKLMRQTTEMKEQLTELQMEILRAKEVDDMARAEALAARAADLEQDMGHVESEALARREALARAQMEAKLDVLRAEAAAARAAGNLEAAREMERMLEKHVYKMMSHNASVDLHPVDEDVALHEDAMRAREKSLRIKLEKLEAMKLESRNELEWREQAIEELRRELAEIHPRD